MSLACHYGHLLSRRPSPAYPQKTKRHLHSAVTCISSVRLYVTNLEFLPTRRSASTHGRRNRGVLGWHYPPHFWDPGVQLPSYQAFLIIFKRKLHRSSEISNVLYATDFLVCISIAPRNNVCGARKFSMKLGIFSETSREITHFSPWITLVPNYYAWQLYHYACVCPCLSVTSRSVKTDIRNNLAFGGQNQRGRAQRLICLRIQRSIVRRLSIIARSSGLVTIESGNLIQRLHYEIPSLATFLSSD